MSVMTTPEDPAAALAATDALLTTTRAVRRRLDLERPVPRQLLLDCVRIAQQAPTPSNTQTWHFVVVTDAEKRAQLASLYRDAQTAAVAAAVERHRAKADPQTQRVYESAAYLSDVLDRVPVHVLPCVRRPLSSTPSAAELAVYYATIIPAAWSFMLAARSRGLGSVWTTQTVAREAEVASLLGLPADVRHVALIPVAFYTGDTFSPAARPEPDTITSWNSWEQS
jgi:nitroreductase